MSGRPAVAAGTVKPLSLREALTQAGGHPSFWLLNAGFFVCGFQVVFYGVHLPAYVADKGLEPSVAVTGLIAVGIGNLIGTYLAGQSGRIMEKRRALSLIYGIRALVFVGFLVLPITPLTIIALSGALGLVWLSTVPLTSGLVATFFGPKWMTMLYGIVFLSHQIGSFLGVWMGGLVYDATKSYDTMWWISIGLGLFAAIIHWPIQERAASPSPGVGAGAR
jgi:predicted MFS family arabinose efflux permease